MTSEAESAPDSAPRGPPHGVKVTPIPPPSIPYSSAPAAAAAAAPDTGSHAGSPAATQTISFSVTPAATAAAADTAAPPPPLSTLPQKRTLAEDDHTPAVRSPLNSDSRATPDAPAAAPREKRIKKESLKKRESKGALAGSETSRATPEPKRRENGTGGTNGSSTGTGAGADNDRLAANDGLPGRVRLAVPLRPTDFDQPASPIFRSHHSAEVASGQEVEFFELFTEQPINRRGYVYESGIADPRFPSIHYFRQTEPKPHYAHFCFEDAPAGMYFDQSGLQVNGDGGFRTTRANVAARQGRWYWECKVTRGIVLEPKADGLGGPGEADARGHVRMGWARREASRDAPVGYDAYGYGIRDRKGQKVHMSRPKGFFVDDEDIREGDVIGLEIQLPSEALHRKVVQGSYNPAVDLVEAEGAGPNGGSGHDRSETGNGNGSADGPNVVRDRNPFRFQTSKLVFEKFDYLPIKELEDLANAAPTLSASSAGALEPPNPNHPVPCLRTLPGSFVRVYKNGVLQGTPFTSLLSFLPPASSANAKMQEGARERLDDGTLGYYPAVSTFRGGAVEANFGPHFWFPPPELEAESVADDVMMVEVGGDTEDASIATSNNHGSALVPPSLTKLRPVADRYEEQIAEDIVYDLVDEVYFWVLDGCKSEVATETPGGSAGDDSKDAMVED